MAAIRLHNQNTVVAVTSPKKQHNTQGSGRPECMHASLQSLFLLVSNLHDVRILYVR